MWGIAREIAFQGRHTKRVYSFGRKRPRCRRSVQMIVPVRSHTDTKVWTKIANTTDTRHSSVRDFPDTGVSSTTLECNGRGMTRKYEVYIDMNKLHTALFHVDMLTSYFSTTSTPVVEVLNNQLTRCPLVPSGCTTEN